MRLFYRKEAQAWEETLPLGNGSLGAMVWGGTETEKIGLNQDTIWSGYPRDKRNLESAKYLDEVRELIFEGSYKKAQHILEKHMLGEFTESYLPLGTLTMELGHNIELVENYERELTLNDAVARVKYNYQGGQFGREYFVSYPSRAFLIKYTADQKNLNVNIHFGSELKYEAEVQSDGLCIEGQCPEHIGPDYLEGDGLFWGERGVRFCTHLTVLHCDGEVAVSKRDGIRVEDAGELILAYTFESEQQEKKRLDALFAEQGYDGLLEQHKEDYSRLFDRVELYLGEQSDLPTDVRLEQIRHGIQDNSLFALYYQYGRYLLISSSRQGGFPANLQGIWNWQMRPPWSSNFTTNINLQMNYWPALSCNLEECMEPYFDFLENLVEHGKETAQTYYNCRGFSVAHNSDRWYSTNPVGVPYGEKEGVKDCAIYAYFPLGGAWLSTDLWRYYEYVKDKKFLKEKAYPMLREAVLFCLDWLVPYGEYYVTCPSSSPENYFYIPDGENDTASMIFACTMDMTIIKEVFEHFINTCNELDLYDELLEEMKEKMDKLYPFQIGKFGQLQEWPIDFKEAEPGHRHVSHLYGLYPGRQFLEDEEMMSACRVVLERRLLNGGGHTGWSCGWIAILFAILGEGEKVSEFLTTLLARSTYPNLWDAHPPFQIDGNFGGIEAIANALVQEVGDEVKVLPALPPEWKEGYVKGLCLRNKRCIDISWEDGKLKDYKIYDK